jgi:hypothetical protein
MCGNNNCYVMCGIKPPLLYVKDVVMLIIMCCLFATKHYTTTIVVLSLQFQGIWVTRKRT